MRENRGDGGIQVMEHREPPQFATGDRRHDRAIDEPDGQLGIRTFGIARNRRQIDFGRTALLVIAGLAIIAGVIYLGLRSTRAALAWLAQQAPYQVPFEQIELVSEPPRWYRGGSRAFLAAVRRSAGAPERVSTLDGTPDLLKADFKKYAWVKEVKKVVYAPGRIEVDLDYCQPVAWVQLGAGEQVIIDERAVILPAEDVNPALLGQVVKITGHGLTPPADPQPGLVWKSRERAGGPDGADDRILAAAKLACFLAQETQTRDAEQSPALRILEISVTEFGGVEPRRLFVINAEGAAIWWRNAPGEERSDEPSALEKWAMLRRWQETTRARFLEPGDFWSFSSNRLHHVCPRKHLPAVHRPKEQSERPGDPPAATTKMSPSG
jgi:hypothetical protein